MKTSFRKSIAYYLLISASLATPVLAGDVGVNVESSGPYKLDQQSFADIYRFKDSFDGTRYQRQALTREIANCSIEDCYELFTTPIMNFKQGFIEEFGEEKGNSYFLTVLSGMIASQSQELSSRALEAGKFGLSFEEKIYISQNLGDVMASNYDYARADEGTGAEGVVTKNELYSAIRENIEAGVCRDIATAQASALNDLGVSNVYVIGFSTIDGGHATVIAQDKENPSQVVHINYGDVSLQSSLTSGIFNQNTYAPDAGSAIQIYDAFGKTIDKVPSEVGYILLKTAGLNPEDYGAGVSRRGVHLVSVDYVSGNVKVTMSGASTASGNQVASLGGTYTVQDSENATVKIGGALNLHKRETNEYSLQNTGFLLGLETSLRTNKYDFGPLKKNFLELGIVTNVYAGKAENSSIDNTESGSVIDAITRISVSYQTQVDITDSVQFTTRASADMAFMQGDVRDEQSRSLQYTGVTLSNNLLIDISENYEVEFENRIYIRKGSTTAENTFYIKSKDGKNVVEVGYDLPLSENAHPWMVGANKEVKIGYQRSVGNFDLKIKYTNLIELNEGFYNLEVKGKF